MYSCGNKFILNIPKGVSQEFNRNGEKYVLAQVDAYMVALIGLNDGNRWADPVKVKDTRSVNEWEWAEISQAYSGETFELDMRSAEKNLRKGK
jgi:hypothetical protein